MRVIKHHWGKLVGAAVGCIALGVVMMTVLADEVPVPVLSISPAGTNLNVTLSNTLSSLNYELYATPVLGDAGYPFDLLIIGQQGQTNFVVERGVYSARFLRAAVGSDWDQDDVDNYMDGDPTNPDVGALTIMIDSPLNGAVFN